MATNPTPGKIYLVESDSDDWIGDHAGDVDLIDFDSFTAEGTDWCQMSFPMSFIKRGHTGAVVTVEGGALQSDARSRKRYYTPTIMATCKNKTTADLIGKFLMSDRHTSGRIATFKRYHLIVYYGANNHALFTDPNDARLSYLPGIVTNWHINWSEPNHINRNVKLNFNGVF